MAALTPHQEQAYDAVYARLTDARASFTTLQGYAGTGKTYLLGQLIDQLTFERFKVNVCAPTHKAAQVLRDKILQRGITTQTIHAFLGLRLVPDKQGGYVLAVEKGRQLPREGIVIVDEASMVGHAEWHHIAKAAHLQWLFVGDPAQLPPVNQGDSAVFALEGPQLEEVVRQAQDNPILRLATDVRHGKPLALNDAFANGQGIGVTRQRKRLLQSALRAFETEDYAKDATFARVLAYRNKTVAAYNRDIRVALHGHDTARFVEGEWLVAKDTWYHQGIAYLINSEEVRIQAAEETECDIYHGDTWRIWLLEVKSTDDLFPRFLNVLHESEEVRYQQRLEKLKAAALKDDKKWEDFYRLKEAFAHVDYAYAITIHKSQGSTFDTAFVDYRDTRACRGPEAQALLYVAVTRPAKRLALLV